MQSEEWALPPHCGDVSVWSGAWWLRFPRRDMRREVGMGESRGCMTRAQPALVFSVLLSPAFCGTVRSRPEPFQGSGEAVSLFLISIPLHSHLEFGFVLYAESVSSPPSAFPLPRVC